MFHQLISTFLTWVGSLITTIVSNPLLAWIFYLGILGIILDVVKVIISVSNTRSHDKDD